MNSLSALVPVSLLVGVSAAQAEVPAAVTTAITTAGADAAVIGGAVLVVMFGIWAFKLMRQAK